MTEFPIFLILPELHNENFYESFNSLFNVSVPLGSYDGNEKNISNSISFILKTLISDTLSKSLNLNIDFTDDTVYFYVKNFILFNDSESLKFDISIEELLNIKNLKAAELFLGDILLENYNNDYFEISDFQDLFSKISYLSNVFNYPFIEYIKSSQFFYRNFLTKNKENESNFSHFYFKYDLKSKKYLIFNKNFYLGIHSENFHFSYNKQSVSLKYSNSFETNKKIILSILNSEEFIFYNLSDFIKLNSLINY